MPRDMSWLSPKRRRTTTALPTVHSGARKNGVEDERALSPSPRFTSPKPVLPSPSLKQRPSRAFSSASTTSATGSPEGEGNLFYAYARRADDLHSRYLLTFASAQVANEWWSLIQTCYPDTTRPGPQLFSFKADDFLEQAWKHSALAHLKPEWMYIQFDDSTRGAAQGIIPVQDVQGNLLGGAASSSSEQKYGRSETRKDVMNGSGMLEERFEKMMEVVERNTEQISALADERGREQPQSSVGTKGTNGAVDRCGMPELSSHLERISQMLEQNSAHVASLAQRQAENEQRMREMIETQQARETAQQPDMGQLTSHLDRIQKLMERNAHGRKDSARDIRTSPPRVDLSPLTFWLEKVLSAVEQNSELVKELLEEKQHARSSDVAQQVELDLSPLSQRLDDLLDAQEAKATRDQEAHTQANQRLDKIIDAQHKAVERGPFDVSLLSQRLDEILSVHRDVATTALTEPLEAIRDASEQNSSHLASLLEAHHESGGEDHNPYDFEPLTEHLEALRATTEQNSTTMIELLESLAADRHIVTESNKTALTPFDDDRANAALERQGEGPGIGDSKFLLSALTSHLSKIQAVTETNANAVRSTRESSHALQRSLTSAVSDTSNSIRELASKHKDLSAQVAVREGQVREVVRSQADMVECVRELAKTIKAQDKNTCNHVVVPPPRKTNRKVVGFVYDAKDGKAS